MNKAELTKKIEGLKAHSAWARGVKVYALELLEGLEVLEVLGESDLPDNWEQLKKLLLNGAENWTAYSWGGCSLIYDQDIARRLCTPSELKKTKGGFRKPNARESWLDCQARALYQACNLIYRAMQ